MRKNAQEFLRDPECVQIGPWHEHQSRSRPFMKWMWCSAALLQQLPLHQQKLCVYVLLNHPPCAIGQDL